MTQKRETISKKTRFEVFKRDNFTCQYCGRTAPDVVLEIDHINPVNNGGKNDIMNLITSCFECNRGKGKRKLNDNTELKLQIEQLKQLNEKRKQLEMLVEWKKELQLFENEQVEKIEDLIYNATNYTFTEYGKQQCKNNIKRYGFDEVYESTLISIEQYYDENDKESAQKVINYIGRICAVRKKQKENPNVGKINYLIAIAQNRLYYVDKNKLKTFLNKYFREQDYDNLKELFCIARNWTNLMEILNEYYETYLEVEDGD